VVTVADVEVFLQVGHESRSFEVKGPASTSDRPYVARIARALMAMGNLRDGGLVVLGIDDTQLAAMEPGLAAVELAEWSDFDTVSGLVAKYSDPPVSFVLQPLQLSNGVDVVALEVAEFEHDIHICKKEFQGVLQNGHTYVRPRGEPRSVTVPTSAEMRELHTLAIDKGVREFLRRAGAVGLPLHSAPSPADAERAAFDQERDQAWASPTPVDEPADSGIGAWVSEPAYFDVTVRPGPYQADRIAPNDLVEFLEKRTVRLRGWPVPRVAAEPVLRHGTWVAQDVVSSPHVEAWRLFTSGQFLHRRMLFTELRHSQELSPTTAAATGAVAVWDVLFYMVEVAEFAARVATALAVEAVTVEVSLERITGRELVSGDFKREIHGPYLAAGTRFAGKIALDVSALLEDPRTVGVILAQQLLQQFGLGVPDKVLFDWQAKELRKS